MSTVDAVTSVLSAGDAGRSADEIAAALGLPLDGAALQPDLEEMVERGILDRCGIGRGALYTLMAPLPTTRDASDHSGMVGKGPTGPTTRMAG
jgi:hypothetical protein